MLKNSNVTIFHKSLDEKTKLEKWTRFNYKNTWIFGGKGASIKKGYENADNVDVRIFYEENKNLNIDNFSIGDIIVEKKINFDITSQTELSEYDLYFITSIINNNFGNNRHIHIGGK